MRFAAIEPTLHHTPLAHLSAALGRITSKTFVMPIGEDMFFPPRDCKAEQEMIPGKRLRQGRVSKPAPTEVR